MRAPLANITRGPFLDSEIQPQMPTELRPDLNVGLRFLDSYAVPFLRRRCRHRRHHIR
jgi:hypothetical protein